MGLKTWDICMFSLKDQDQSFHSDQLEYLDVLFSNHELWKCSL